MKAQATCRGPTSSKSLHITYLHRGSANNNPTQLEQDIFSQPCYQVKSSWFTLRECLPWRHFSWASWLDRLLFFFHWFLIRILWLIQLLSLHKLFQVAHQSLDGGPSILERVTRSGSFRKPISSIGESFRSAMRPTNRDTPKKTVPPVSHHFYVRPGQQSTEHIQRLIGSGMIPVRRLPDMPR
jgi:hypothetical protein